MEKTNSNPYQIPLKKKQLKSIEKSIENLAQIHIAKKQQLKAIDNNIEIPLKSQANPIEKARLKSDSNLIEKAIGKTVEKHPQTIQIQLKSN